MPVQIYRNKMELPPAISTQIHTNAHIQYISIPLLKTGMPMIRQRSRTLRNLDPQCFGNASATFKAAFAGPHTYTCPIMTSPLGKHVASQSDTGWEALQRENKRETQTGGGEIFWEGGYFCDIYHKNSL